MPRPISRTVADGRRGRRARAGVEQAELAEHLAGPEDGQQVLAAVAAGPPELDLALDDDVELVALVALVEEGLGAAEVDLDHRLPQRARGALVQRREQRGAAHDVVVHDLSFARRLTWAVCPTVTCDTNLGGFGER